MKKLSVVALLLALVTCFFAFVGCSKKDPSVPDGMILASGENVDYFMYVPEGWKVDKSELYTSAYFSSGDATSISTTAYGVSAETATVDAWWKTFEPQLKSVYTDISEIAVTDAKLGGIEGKEYSFTAKLAEKEYNFIITAVVKDFYIYYVTYTSTPEYNEDHLEERVKVIESFEFNS
ncbi:MAG: hypothetical protein IJ046_00530 [Clostridia bacterium]|nr:hypothetical protein [Clostridia bacterium]